MKKYLVRMTMVLMMLAGITEAAAQDFNQLTDDGDFTARDSRSNGNFNPHNNDTTKQTKVVPKGIYVWTVDRKFGDRQKAEVDTLPHLYPHSTLATGRYGQYNTTGSNYTARQNRIFIDRQATSQFLFTDIYDQVMRQPDEWHFTNTLSPITNLTYDNCGDKTTGEDHIDARFAVNAGKRVGLGFDLNYLYARGYYQNQSTSHFLATVYGSYLGDQYQMHALFSTNHQKVSENGGITNDEFITHPELYTETYAENEIPVYLGSNWNRNHGFHGFLTHRYNVGFYRKVKMTEEELKARAFAAEAEKEKGSKNKKRRKTDEENEPQARPRPSGRPDNAPVLGDAPAFKSDSLTNDSTRIKVESKQMADSLMAAQARQDSIDATMKQEFVPVTSFIHTLDIASQDHIYQAYTSPDNFYKDTFFNIGADGGYPGDSIYDQTQLLNIKNTVAIALLEGFNKYVPAGLKVFATHDYRRFDMPELDKDGNIFTERWNNHGISLGGQLIKSQGHTLHYNAMIETWITGDDAGQLKINGSTDLNFPLFGDTVRLAAKAYFYRLNPTFLQRHYHSKHLWWDNDLSKETRTRIEGNFKYEKTNTSLRVAIEEMQNYTYLGMSYGVDGEKRNAFTATMRQHSGNINVMTAQLDQKLTLGPIHWDNILTYQLSSNEDVLPLPTLNVFSNLYLKFKIAQVLTVELGGAATWFTKYYAPDYCPMLSQYAVQQNGDVRRELGNFPFIDVYANLHLKHARFFLMMTNATGTAFNRQAFLTPHYPLNQSTLHMGVSWNFFN